MHTLFKSILWIYRLLLLFLFFLLGFVLIAAVFLALLVLGLLLCLGLLFLHHNYCQILPCTLACCPMDAWDKAKKKTHLLLLLGFGLQLAEAQHLRKVFKESHCEDMST